MTEKPDRLLASSLPGTAILEMWPYIGIVGLKDPEEAFKVAGMVHVVLGAKDITKKFTHHVQIGVQVTDKTLRGKVTESRRNPKVADIPEMFRTALSFRDDFFTVVHYTPKNYESILDSVRKIMSLDNMYKNGWCHGLQLNGCFGKMNRGTLSRVKGAYPDLKVILQIPGEALTSMKAVKIARKLKEFNDLADYALIDPSGGRGQEMDVESGLKVAKAILGQTGIDVAFAGGLKGSNVFDIVTRLREGLGHTNFSIDAEGGLRDKLGEGYGNDDFNLRKAEEYFRNAVRAFQ